MPDKQRASRVSRTPGVLSFITSVFLSFIMGILFGIMVTLRYPLERLYAPPEMDESGSIQIRSLRTSN